MPFEEKPAKMPDRPYEKLSQASRDHIISDLELWLAEGYCQPEMEPSLLGLDWSSFVTRRFPEYGDQTSFWNPPEFIFYAFSALDVYATALLATQFSCRSLGVLNFTCNLKRHDPESQMHMEFMTTPERGRIDPSSVMLELLRSFPRFLQTKRIEAGAVSFLEGEGCRMQIAYPGRMVAKASPFLRNRPDDLWPQVTLSFAPTDEMRIRAQDIVAFLLSSDAMDGRPN